MDEDVNPTIATPFYLSEPLRGEFTIEIWLKPKRMPRPNEVQVILSKPGIFTLMLRKSPTFELLEGESPSPMLSFFMEKRNLSCGVVTSALCNHWHYLAVFQKITPRKELWMVVKDQSNGGTLLHPEELCIDKIDAPLYVGMPVGDFTRWVGDNCSLLPFKGVIRQVRISKGVRYEWQANPPREFDADKSTIWLLPEEISLS